jgi:hypothetical protein
MHFCEKKARILLLSSALTALISLTPGSLLGQTDTFTNGAGTGFWNNAGNWSAGLPGSSNNVFITGSGSASSVTEDVSATINNLTLNSGNSWILNNGFALTINGNSISNAGTMSLNSTGNFTELIIHGSGVTLSGGGTLTMSNNANNYIFGSVTADTLTNQETIQGAGHIGNGVMTLVNSGTINANQSAGMTIQTNGGTTNTGTIEATGGTLLFTSTTVTNTGGTISTTGQTLTLTNSTINDGTVTLTGAADLQLANGVIHGASTLTNSATGTIETTAGSGTLGGTVDNSAGGVIKINNGTVLNLENGSYPKLGTVNLNSTGSVTELEVAGANVTLSGGTVTMSNQANNYILGAVTADTLTNQETIQGAGHLGNGTLTLVNSGTINATQSAGITFQTNGGTTNTGTIEATGGPLAFTSTTVTNTGGTILDSGQALAMTNSTINGGTVTLTGAANLQMTNGVIHSGSILTNSPTGTIENVAGTSTLGGTVTNPAGGLIQIDNGSILHLENGTYNNAGSITLNSSPNFTELVVDGANVTLTGKGTVTLSNNANNLIFGAVGTNQLTNKETIQGSGNIGHGQMTLVNYYTGSIIANQSVPLLIQTSGPFTNYGSLVVGTGDTMHVFGGSFTNFSRSTLTGGTYNRVAP